MSKTIDTVVFNKPIDTQEYTTVRTNDAELKVSENMQKTTASGPIAVPKYGVTPVQGTPVAKYGVIPVTPVPKYGVQGPSDISITYEQLEQNIANLKQAIASLRESWTNQTKKNLDTLNNSWVGDDCRRYTFKLGKMDKRVNDTISALELLCRTYEQARDMVKDQQMSTISSIASLD